MKHEKLWPVIGESGEVWPGAGMTQKQFIAGAGIDFKYTERKISKAIKAESEKNSPEKKGSKNY